MLKNETAVDARTLSILDGMRRYGKTWDEMAAIYDARPTADVPLEEFAKDPLEKPRGRADYELMRAEVVKMGLHPDAIGHRRGFRRETAGAMPRKRKRSETAIAAGGDVRAVRRPRADVAAPRSATDQFDRRSGCFPLEFPPNVPTEEVRRRPSRNSRRRNARIGENLSELGTADRIRPEWTGSLQRPRPSHFGARP